MPQEIKPKKLHVAWKKINSGRITKKHRAPAKRKNEDEKGVGKRYLTQFLSYN
jgi:hypothetical protein